MNHPLAGRTQPATLNSCGDPMTQLLLWKDDVRVPDVYVRPQVGASTVDNRCVHTCTR